MTIANPLEVEQETVMKNLVTTHQLARMFRRAPITVMLWKRNEGLPYVSIPGDNRPAIRYDMDQVTAWANRTGKRIFVTRNKDAAVASG